MFVIGAGPDGMCSWSKALRAQRPEKSGTAELPAPSGGTAKATRIGIEEARSKYARRVKSHPQLFRQYQHKRVGQTKRRRQRTDASQYRALPGVLGNGMASRTLESPVT